LSLDVLVPQHSRDYFVNHAFVVDDGRVFDACAGPHLGTEDIETYTVNMIDTESEDPVARAAKRSKSGGTATARSIGLR
jgi:hypothetical protein